jgi:hypothetical protein
MSIIKSNSALIAFDGSVFSNTQNFIFLNFIQSISFEVQSNRIKSKHIGSSTSIVNQFTNPEINLSLTFLQRKDFLNENIFGMNFSSSESDSEYAFKNIVNDFYNTNSLILFNNIDNNDLIYSNINSLMYSVSFGNLYLNSYSVSYKINELPSVSADFLSGDVRIEKILDNVFLKNWNNTNIELSTDYINALKLNTDNAEPLVYVMTGLSMSNNFNEQAFTPGVIIDSLLNGVIQSLDTSFDFSRSKLYFFEKKNSVSSRKILLPITGSLKITGISYNINIGNINDFFNQNSSFNMHINILDELKEISSKIIYENLIVEKFSYSINMNGMLEYSLDCSFQVTDNSGYKIIRNVKSFKTSLFEKIASSELEDLLTSDGYSLYAKN